MTLAVAWVVFPALLLTLSLGAGLVVDFLAGRRLPGILLVPVGLALIVVVSRTLTYWQPTARLATPSVLALGVLGLALLAAGQRVLRPDPWAVAVFAAVYCVFAAPVLLSGQATFAGYGLLGDTSVHLTIVDRLMTDGRDLSNLPPSSYRSALEAYVDSSYPVGAHAALGALRPLTGQDVAWLFAPFVAVLAALASLSLYSITGALTRSRPLRFASALIAAQPALVVAYSLQGSIKEVATIALLPLLIALLPTLRGTGGARRVLPCAVTAAALLCVLGPAAAVWVGPALVICVGLLYLADRPRTRQVVRDIALLTVLVAALSLPVLLSASTFFRVANEVLTTQTEIGNLIHPLNKLQAFGVWLTGDYRLSPAGFDLAATRLMIAIVAGLVVAGVVLMVRDRIWLPLALLAVSLIGTALATLEGSPWADAKALMICSSALLLTATLAAAAAFDRGHRAVAIVAGIVLATGVLWSNALAYHEVKLAPRERLVELSDIGDRVSGKGPTLYTEFEEFGKHFLRDGAPTGWSESWHPPAPGGRFEFTENLDQVPLEQLRRYRTIVLRRSPVESRPPAGYELIESGRWYSVWQRGTGAPELLRHLPAGHELSATGTIAAVELRALAAVARSQHGRLAYVQAPAVSVAPVQTLAPRRWALDRDGLSLRPAGPGRIVSRLRIHRSARYVLWLRGSFGRNVEVDVDGRRAGTVPPRLSGRGTYERVAELSLARGFHEITIARGGGNLSPGSGAQGLVGPLVAAQARPTPRVSYLPAGEWNKLVGRQLDWVEVTRTR